MRKNMISSRTSRTSRTSKTNQLKPGVSGVLPPRGKWDKQDSLARMWPMAFPGPHRSAGGHLVLVALPVSSAAKRLCAPLRGKSEASKPA